MASQMLLLIIIIIIVPSLHVCVGTFVVDVLKSSYQVLEDQDLTLEWTFTRQSDAVPLIICDVHDDHGDPKTLYYLHGGEEQLDSQDEQFSGRVQCERDVLSEGRVKLRLSRVTLNDSGLYVCEVHIGADADFARCEVNVSAATPRPRPDGEGGLAVYVTLAVVMLAVVVLASVGGALIHRRCCVSRHEVIKSVIESDCETLSVSDPAVFNTITPLLAPRSDHKLCYGRPPGGLNEAECVRKNSGPQMSTGCPVDEC